MGKILKAKSGLKEVRTQKFCKKSSVKKWPNEIRNYKKLCDKDFEIKKKK